MNLDFFEKQLLIDNFSEKLQKKIFDTNCLVIGGGGIAHPLITYLVSTGFGNISIADGDKICLLYTSPSPRDNRVSRMPSSA